MTTPPEKPPTLPEQPDADDNPTEPTPAITNEDAATEPTPPVSDEDTQPRRPSLIPAPPNAPGSRSRVIRRRKSQQPRGWGGALLLAALLSLLILLLGVVFLLIYAPEYADPFIPGRLDTRTAEAANLTATAALRQTEGAAFNATQSQIAVNIAATGTAQAVISQQQATQNALNAEGTAYALVQTATGGAVAFDATRTAVALQAQSTAAANTLEAVRLQFTQTAVAILARTPTPVPIEPDAGLIPTAGSRFDVIFQDTFDRGLNNAWTQSGEWRSVDGVAYSTICGTSITIGSPSMRDFAVQVDVANPGAQFALLTGYADTGQLYVNFGLGGALWWLVSGADSIDDQTTTSAYTPRDISRVRLEVRDRLVTVIVDNRQIAERLLPDDVRGPVGLYTCPTGNAVPRFDNFRIERLD